MDAASPPRTLVLHSDAPESTQAAAAALAPLLQPGDVIALSGELGAGKTCFVQGVARALGVEEHVTSPTFVLVKLYDGGRLPITHCDVYRLETLRDVDDLGDEVMAPDRVTFLEWGDAVRSLLPEDHLEVELLLDGPSDGVEGADPVRRLLLHGHGGWTRRWDELTAATADWT